MNRFIFRAQSLANILLSTSGMIDCQMIYLACALCISLLPCTRFHSLVPILLMRHFQSILRSTIENLFIENGKNPDRGKKSKYENIIIFLLEYLSEANGIVEAHSTTFIQLNSRKIMYFFLT